MELSEIDLNLLVYLDALLAERHVTNAGKRVGLSQSAMSRALSRLRDLFEDELLVKTPHGMTPTPMAVKLEPEIRRLLRQIERAVTGQDSFDASVDVRALEVVASDTCQRVLLPELVDRIQHDAPGVRLKVSTHDGELRMGALARGEIDLLLGPAPRAERALRVVELWRDPIVGVTRADLDDLDLKSFADLPHLTLTAPAEGAATIDLALREVGLSRAVIARLPHSGAIAPLLERVRAVACLPRSVARTITGGALRIQELPLVLAPVVFTLSWHMRGDTDAAATWVRERVEGAAESLRDDLSR